MDKFFCDLEEVLEKYNTDVTALDDYEVEVDFVRSIICSHFNQLKTKVVSVNDIHVFDGPHVSAISSSLSIRFEVTVLPDYNIEEKETLKIFIKVPPFEGQVETAGKLCQKEIRVYSELFADIYNFMSNPLKGPYKAPLPTLLFSDLNRKLLVLQNVAEEGFYSPRERLMDRSELKSVLRALAKFHADGLKFLKETGGQSNKYDFLQRDVKRADFVTELLDKYLEPYLTYLEQFTPVRPAVLLLRTMSKKGNISEDIVREMDKIPQTLRTICHMNIWTGNVFLQEKPGSHSEHNVVLVDWTHCQLAPFTCDVIHLIFTCCGADMMSDWTELLNDYYDYIKGYLSTHALDRNNMGLCFDTYWDAVSKTMRAEFIEETVIRPLTLLFGSLPKDEPLSPDDLTDIFESADMIEEDVLPMMQLAMSLGLTKPVEQLEPEMFKECGRRGSVLSNKLVTRKESLKDPVPACVRRKRSSLALPRPQRRPSQGRDNGEEGSRGSSPGGIISPSNLSRSASIGRLSRSNSRRGSDDPNSGDPLVALRAFQMQQSKQFRKPVQSTSESLGSALKMIKKRRSLFEHASVFGYGAW